MLISSWCRTARAAVRGGERTRRAPVGRNPTGAAQRSAPRHLERDQQVPPGADGVLGRTMRTGGWSDGAARRTASETPPVDRTRRTGNEVSELTRGEQDRPGLRSGVAGDAVVVHRDGGDMDRRGVWNSVIGEEAEGGGVREQCGNQHRGGEHEPHRGPAIGDTALDAHSHGTVTARHESALLGRHGSKHHSTGSRRCPAPVLRRRRGLLALPPLPAPPVPGQAARLVHRQDRDDEQDHQPADGVQQ
jgi:hypothetical protein